MNNNFFGQQSLAPSYITIGSEFCKLYYSKLKNGVNNIHELFDPNVICSVEGNELCGSYNLLMWFVNQSIHHFDYRNVSGISLPFNNNEILVSTQGMLKAIGFWGQESGWTRFNEVFILENIGNNRYVVKKYIIRTIL
jgi:hypothetical protein